jgi:peroxiredoxin
LSAFHASPDGRSRKWGQTKFPQARSRSNILIQLEKAFDSRMSALALFLLQFAVAFFLAPAVNAQATPASITTQMKNLDNLPLARRQAETLEIVHEIRSLPAGMPKLWLANGLTHLICAYDVDQKTLLAIALTLENALLEAPPPDPLDRKLLYMDLANFIHYENVHVDVKDPELTRALAVIVANDAEVSKANFTLRDINGNKVTLSELRGKIVLLTFWATWCVPCREEMPTLDILSRRFQSKGLVLLSLTSEKSSTVKRIIQRMNYRPTVLLDPEDKVKDQFHVSQIPHSFVFDRSGKFVADSIDARTQQQFFSMLAKAGLQP